MREECERVEDGASRLFELLLGAELVGVSALALAAVGGTGGEDGPVEVRMSILRANNGRDCSVYGRRT